MVDDHKLFREGLSFVISQMDHFDVVGEAPDGCTFLEMIDNIDVDIALLDISMPGIDGITAASIALKKHPKLKVIALSMYSNEDYLLKMIKAGASGYLLKETVLSELLVAFSAVIAGKTYFSKKLVHNIVFNQSSSKE